MPRGRPPKHPRIHQLQGSTAQTVLDWAVEAHGLPFIPEHLMDDARGCLEIIQQSMPEGIYARLDTFVLSAFALAWALHKEAAMVIAERGREGIVYTTPETGVQHKSPWVSVLNEQAGVMISAAAQLGISPIARARLGTSGAQRQASKFGELLGGRERSALSGSLKTSLSQVASDRVPASS